MLDERNPRKKIPANHRYERHHRHGAEEASFLSLFLHDDEYDDGMTVPKYTINLPSCKNPIGIGKNTAHYANDGDHDDSQRFSKGAPLSREASVSVRKFGPSIAASTGRGTATSENPLKANFRLCPVALFGHRLGQQGMEAKPERLGVLRFTYPPTETAAKLRTNDVRCSAGEKCRC